MNKPVIVPPQCVYFTKETPENEVIIMCQFFPAGLSQEDIDKFVNFQTIVLKDTFKVDNPKAWLMETKEFLAGIQPIQKPEPAPAVTADPNLN